MPVRAGADGGRARQGQRQALAAASASFTLAWRTVSRSSGSGSSLHASSCGPERAEALRADRVGGARAQPRVAGAGERRDRLLGRLQRRAHEPLGQAHALLLRDLGVHERHEERSSSRAEGAVQEIEGLVVDEGVARRSAAHAERKSRPRVQQVEEAEDRAPAPRASRRAGPARRSPAPARAR